MRELIFDAEFKRVFAHFVQGLAMVGMLLIPALVLDSGTQFWLKWCSPWLQDSVDVAAKIAFYLDAFVLCWVILNGSVIIVASVGRRTRHELFRPPPEDPAEVPAITGTQPAVETPAAVDQPQAAPVPTQPESPA
jgi:hypothetical protein